MTMTMTNPASDIRIRPAVPDDANAMLAILNPIIERGGLTTMVELITPEQQRAFIKSFPDDGVFLVATKPSTGAIIGMQDIMRCDGRGVDASKHSAQISTFVSLHHARMGVGRALFASLEPRACARGYERLLATVQRENTRAQKFYRSLGFVDTDASCTDDAIELEHLLS